MHCRLALMVSDANDPADKGRIEIPQRSSLLPYRGVLSFESTGATTGETTRVHGTDWRRGSRLAAWRARAAGQKPYQNWYAAVRFTIQRLGPGRGVSVWFAPSRLDNSQWPGLSRPPIQAARSGGLRQQLSCRTNVEAAHRAASFN